MCDRRRAGLLPPNVGLLAACRINAVLIRVKDALLAQLLKLALGYQQTIVTAKVKVTVEVPADLAAIKEVFDRVQGKAAQAIERSGPEGEPPGSSSSDTSLSIPKVGV